MKLIEHFIGGEKFSGTSNRLGKVFNPATGEQSAEVKLANKTDVDRAVESSKRLLRHGQIHLHFKEPE